MKALGLALVLVFSAARADAKQWHCTCDSYGCTVGYLLKTHIEASFSARIEADSRDFAELTFRGQADEKATEACKSKSPGADRGVCTSFKCVDAYEPSIIRPRQ